MKIDNISLKIIPDSKGKDTLEAEMSCGEVKVTASVPAGVWSGPAAMPWMELLINQIWGPI